MAVLVSCATRILSSCSLIRAVILVQAENEYSESTNNNIYMQAIIDLYRANGVVVRRCSFFQKMTPDIERHSPAITHNDQHSGQAGFVLRLGHLPRLNKCPLQQFLA